MNKNTKNLGQIAAIWISPNAPENKRLIWYDTSEQAHKVYELSTGEWMALNPQIVTNSTISDLRNIAQQSGLSVGKYFFLTDVGTIAIAITTTKIWYVDSFNNYVVNDLAANITSYVNSENLSIDGSTGVWDNNTGKLIFNFTTVSSGDDIESENDYVVIRRKVNSNWNWLKCKISNFISAVSNNSISWNKGVYFNFSDAVNNIKNKVGGIVGYEQYNIDKNSINNSINNISQGNQQILSTAKLYTDEKTSEDALLGKQINRQTVIYQNPPKVPGTGSTIADIFDIIFSWISELQKSNIIKIGNGFLSDGRSGNINYSDNVRSAIEKLVYGINLLKISDNVNLPNDFNKDDYDKSLPDANNTITSAIGKITKFIFDLDSEFELYRGMFYSYMNGSWVTFINDNEYSQLIPTHVFRIKNGLLTIRLMRNRFSNANLKHGPWTMVVPLGFFPSDVASKFINSDYFVINSFDLYNLNNDGIGVKYYYSIFQIIKSFVIKRSDDELVNIQIALLFEYTKNEQEVSELTGRMLLGMYEIATNGNLVQLTNGDGYNTSFLLQDEVCSINVDSLLR